MDTEQPKLTPMQELVKRIEEDARNDRKLREQVESVLESLPPVTAAQAPPFDLSIALEDVIDWAITIASRQGADWTEVLALLGPILDLWDDVPYIVGGTKHPVAERREVCDLWISGLGMF